MKAIDAIRRECDVIIRVADPRNLKTLFPFKTRKRIIIVFNKIDICPKNVLDALRKKYRQAVFVSTRTRKGKRTLLSKLSMIAKSEKRLIRVGVIGYPNVGKSSLINMLRGRRSARVSATPGETKGIQWLKIKENILMYDTPGVVINRARMSESELVSSFVISPSKIKNPEAAAERIIVDVMKKRGVEFLRKHYKLNLNSSESPSKIIEKIAKRQGMLLKRGELDLDRAAKKIIMDRQKGKI